MAETKTVGIHCDNYKVPRYKKELTANGFTDYKIKPFVGPTAIIQVRKVPIERVHDIHMICTRLEAAFKRRN